MKTRIKITFEFDTDETISSVLGHTDEGEIENVAWPLVRMIEEKFDADFNGTDLEVTKE